MSVLWSELLPLLIFGLSSGPIAFILVRLIVGPDSISETPQPTGSDE